MCRSFGKLQIGGKNCFVLKSVTNLTKFSAERDDDDDDEHDRGDDVDDSVQKISEKSKFNDERDDDDDDDDDDGDDSVHVIHGDRPSIKTQTHAISHSILPVTRRPVRTHAQSRYS